jgi:hypothetical protein
MKIILIIASLPLLFSFSNSAYAHPGNTAYDGCHYCWTNCTKWGREYGVRHCHGGLKEDAPKPPNFLDTNTKVEHTHDGLPHSHKVRSKNTVKTNLNKL